MKITKDEFKSYVRVQMSGVTNMFDVRMVQELTGLDREKILAIMEQYSELKEQYAVDL